MYRLCNLTYKSYSEALDYLYSGLISQDVFDAYVFLWDNTCYRYSQENNFTAGGLGYVLGVLAVEESLSFNVEDMTRAIEQCITYNAELGNL